MINLFRTNKLYIDFGNFPGPERLPKETVFNGMNILVWNHNAASTNDVMIPRKYKLNTNITVSEVEIHIQNMLNNYERDFHDFDEFRHMISEMEMNYYRQLSQIFGE